MSRETAGCRFVGDEVSQELAELRLCNLRGIGLEDRGLRLDHLAEGPECDTLPVRERTALAPEDDEVGIGVDGLRELPDEPALPDSRHADEGEKLRHAFPFGAGERVQEQVEFL